MEKMLLTTKLYIPPPCPILVSRPRVSRLLSKAITSSLTLVSAPAGYGKTTLVSSWLRETDIPSAWLSLEEGDNDPIRFLQYFLTALQKIIPEIQLDWLDARQGLQPSPFDSLLNIVINEIARRAAPFVFILDDFHTIRAQPVLEMITYFLEHTPPQLHWVLLSRTDPPLPLSRLRACNQLVEIRARDLRFSVEEAQEFLNRTMSLNLTAEEVAALETRTEGWIAGLQLAALSLQGCSDIPAFIQAFAGSHVYIAEYLVEEVLKRQPQDVQAFLLQTSMLERMNVALCETLVGGFERSNVQTFQPSNEILRHLERANLFLVSLDDGGQWFRYHHLFADVLKLRLEHLYPQLVPELHRRASLWYEQQALISEAIHHALMAKDQARVARLVEDHGCSLLMRGEGFTLLKWVEAVEAYTQTHPWLAVLKAWAFALTGNLNRVEPALQAAEGLISSPEPTTEVQIMLGSIAAVRAYLANALGEAQLAADYAQGALEYLPDSNAFSCSIRSVAVSILGDASWINGNLEEARNAYFEAAQISQAAGNLYMTMIANTNLAGVLAEQGMLHQAARIYSETLKMATHSDGQKLPLTDRIYAGLSKINYEWNQLEGAVQYIHQCIELCRQWENSDLLSRGYVMLARLEWARCNPEKAREMMRAAEWMAYEERLTPRQSEWVKYACARWWLTQGSPERAARLVQEASLTSDFNARGSGIPYQQEREHLLLLRLLLAQGDHEAALSVAERLLLQAEAEKRMGRVVELLVLEALVLQGKKDAERAMSVLEKALLLAQPQGFVRVFLDEGEPMAKLLYQAKSRRISSEYASELLSALGGVPSIQPLSVQLMIEPLTRRELEILKLIEAGCTNQDIAVQLVISIPTVKRHISNLYAKLGAKSRTQAVSLGKELKLFE
jgi:ATP/maltotriose-dependent transcriptional regulator MalT